MQAFPLVSGWRVTGRIPMTYSGAGHVAQPKTKLSSSKNELPNHPIETNEEIHQKLKLDRAIHLAKYEIFFNAYVPGLYIGLGMAIRWSMTIPEPAMYSPVSSSKNELPSRPIETNEEMHQKLKLDRAIHLEKI